MDATTLDALKSKLRRRVPESIADAIAELKKALPDFSPKYNPLILLESRLNDANLKNVQNLLSDAELQIEYNQIRADLLLLIDSLEERDFQMILGTPAAKTGSLLYKIPEQMQLQKETKCLVRLAFDQETIIRNIELNEEVTIKQVRVAEVMQVELIDPSAEHPFEIRSISDEEQFLEKGDYTEWVFYVKPLLEGTFPLVLKISVIEMVQGKERLRNLTWEETIQITTSEPALSASEFKSTGIAVGATETDTPEERFMPPAAPAIEPVISFPAPGPAQNIPISPLKKDDFPQIERYEPVPQPKRKPKYRGWLAAAASVLLILTVAIFMLPNSSAPTNEKENKPSPVMEDSSFVLPPLDSLIQDTSTSPQ